MFVDHQYMSDDSPYSNQPDSSSNSQPTDNLASTPFLSSLRGIRLHINHWIRSAQTFHVQTASKTYFGWMLEWQHPTLPFPTKPALSSGSHSSHRDPAWRLSRRTSACFASPHPLPVVW